MNPVSKENIIAFRKSIGLESKSILQLCFGGTRYDKGADIAVNALGHLDDKYHLLVAGKEECSTFKSLNQIAKIKIVRIDFI